MTEKLDIKIEQSWKENLTPILAEPYMHGLRDVVRQQYQDPTKTIYPEPKNLFNAFDSCPFDKVSVVILGQDPIPRHRTSARTLLLSSRRYQLPALPAKHF